jgi:hypothetical protein
MSSPGEDAQLAPGQKRGSCRGGVQDPGLPQKFIFSR